MGEEGLRKENRQEFVAVEAGDGYVLRGFTVLAFFCLCLEFS